MSPAQRSDDPVVAELDDPLVSGIRDRWAEHGLTGEPWPFMAIASVNRLHQILAKALDTELRPLRLSRTGYFLLTTLALMSTGRAKLSTLGRLMMLHPTTVKLTVDQLEREGLVTRRAKPGDRRATLVEITPHGRDRARVAGERLSTTAEGPLGTLHGQYEELFRTLQAVRLTIDDLEP